MDRPPSGVAETSEAIPLAGSSLSEHSPADMEHENEAFRI
jgi:hypothetical protein